MQPTIVLQGGSLLMGIVLPVDRQAGRESACRLVYMSAKCRRSFIGDGWAQFTDSPEAAGGSVNVISF